MKITAGKTITGALWAELDEGGYVVRMTYSRGFGTRLREETRTANNSPCNSIKLRHVRALVHAIGRAERECEHSQSIQLTEQSLPKSALKKKHTRNVR